MASAGFGWGAIDVVDGHAFEDWSKSVQSMSGAGLRVPLWGRVANLPNWDVTVLLEEGRANHSAVVLNIEDEFKTKPPKAFEAQIRAWRRAHPTYTREIVLNTVGWLYNDVDYSAIAHRPVQLQVFATDMHIAPADLPRVTNDCISHARLKGFRDISVCFQTYGVADPSWYVFWPGVRSYFTGDIIGASIGWDKWL